MNKLPLQRKQHENLNFSRYISWKKIIIALMIFCFTFNSYSQVELTRADVNVSVNYLEETATVSAGTGSSIRYYMSTDNKKNWELLDSSGVVDISSLLSSKVVTLYFKGNKDPNPVNYDLAAENSSLKVNYEIKAGVGRITYTPETTVEFRKGNNGIWKPASNNMFTSIYEIKGATLYFRTPATAAARAGKVVTVKIPKRPAAPSVKLDGSKLYISGLKSGETEYRVGDSTTWTTFISPISTNKYIYLNTLLAAVPSANAQIPAGTIEFRTKGTDKKLTSGTKVIDVLLQPTAPAGITLNGTTLTITDTNTQKAYEYSKVASNAILDLSTAKWTTVTSKNPVILQKVSITDKIYVRAKSYTDPTSKQLILASMYQEFTVTSITAK